MSSGAFQLSFKNGASYSRGREEKSKVVGRKRVCDERDRGGRLSKYQAECPGACGDSRTDKRQDESVRRKEKQFHCTQPIFTAPTFPRLRATLLQEDLSANVSCVFVSGRTTRGG